MLQRLERTVRRAAAGIAPTAAEAAELEGHATMLAEVSATLRAHSRLIAAVEAACLLVQHFEAVSCSISLLLHVGHLYNSCSSARDTGDTAVQRIASTFTYLGILVQGSSVSLEQGCWPSIYRH